MSDVNPYQSPSTPANQWNDQSDLESLLPNATKALAQTKPWVRLISVLGLLMFGLTIIGMVFVLRMVGGSMMIGILPFAVLFYLVPSLFLWNYASRIRNLMIDRNAQSLTAAVAAQRSFWRYIGITAAIVIVLYVGALLLAAIVFRM